MNRGRRVTLIAAFLASFALTAALQWRGHAYSSEWTGSPDEPAHYVTGLMLHDYILGGHLQSPMRFAQRYYDHYPKVAFGHWPPGFYLIQSAWTIPFGTSRASLLLLMAALTAALLTVTFALVWRYFSIWLAWGALLFLATSPPFEYFGRMLMGEIPAGLLTWLTIIVLARYLDNPTWRLSLAFAAMAIATILTKQTGLAVAPLPLLAVAVLGRWRLLRTGSFWLPAMMVGAVCVPWFLLAPDAMHQSVALFGGLNIRIWRVAESIRYWMWAIGYLAAPLALLGLLVLWWRRKTERRWDTLWILAMLLPPVTVAFRVVVGAWEDRHLLTTLPSVALLGCLGLEWLLEKAGRWRTVAAGTAVAALLAAVTWNIANTRPKERLGLDRVASELTSDPRFARSSFLILSDPDGEGVFISEVAADEHRVGHVVERGFKELATARFLGGDYKMAYSTPEELMHFLEQKPDRVIVLDSPPRPARHIVLTRETIARYSDRWNTIAVYPRPATGTSIEVFQMKQ